MKPIRTLISTAIALSFLVAGSLPAYAAEIPVAGTIQAEKVVSKVISVDQEKRIVVLAGEGGKEVSVQLTDQAKDLANLKAGDLVKAVVTHSVAVTLDTDVSKTAPTVTSAEEVNRATKDNPTPNGNAFRQVNVQLKVTHIDLKKNQVTFKEPNGQSKVVSVENPDIQARLKNLKVDQTVLVSYTDALEITTQAAK